MKGSLSWFVLATILCFTSCHDKSNPTQVNDIVNFPVTTNVTNSFTYTISASQFSDNSQNNLSFQSDSLVITLTCVDYVSGQAIVSVRDSLSQSIFSDTVKSNKTTAIAHLKTTKPRSCSIVSSSLTARFVFTLVGE
jgi:hypothetical protein